MTKIKRGDQVQVATGEEYRGRKGKLICLFQGQATVLQANRVAIVVDAKHVQPAQQEATGD